VRGLVTYVKDKFKKKEDPLITELKNSLTVLSDKVDFYKEALDRTYEKKIEPIEDKTKKTDELKVFWKDICDNSIDKTLKKNIEATFKSKPQTGFAMDSCDNTSYANSGWGFYNNDIFAYYAQTRFIGYAQCAILCQHWLINKACLVPAEDAIRNWFDILVNDGKKVDKKIIEEMVDLDNQFNLHENLKDAIYKNKVFGIRVVYFVVDLGSAEKNKEFYKNPFNIDAITPGSYKGISQVDPYYMTPEFDFNSASNPASKDYLNPTWWNVPGGVYMHRSHCVVLRTENLPDMIKPMYQYGGIPIPQLIAELVYNAMHAAGDAVELVNTKRTDVVFTNMMAALQNQDNFTQKAKDYIANRRNTGTKYLDLDDRMEQFDTSLTDVVEVQMMLLQLVAAGSNVIASRLLETSPKGFNSGDAEEKAYRLSLETLLKQVTPIVHRHHELIMKSIITPKYKKDFTCKISWKKLDSVTQKEVAEINEIDARTGQTLIMSGAIDPQEERARIAHNEESNYSGIDEDKIIEKPEEESNDSNDYEE